MVESRAQRIRRLDDECRRYEEGHGQDQEEMVQTSRQPAHERKAWPAPGGDDGRSADNAAFMPRSEMLENIINGKLLRVTTSMNRDQFDFISDRFIRQARKHPDRPLFSEDGDEVPGNRCRLPYRHVVLLSLMRKRRGPTREQLAAFFGIDQKTVDRYIRFSDAILIEILPTAGRMTERIRNARTIEEVKKMIPDLALIVSEISVEVQCPPEEPGKGGMLEQEE